MTASDVADLASGVLVVVGTVVALSGGVGLLRLPDFFTRERVVGRGPTTLEGRAWSGRAPIARVEVSDDGGSTWAGARVVRDLDGPWAWVGFTFEWAPAAAGAHTLCCRATDESGDTQPLEAEWNLGGYENNAVQRIPVVVR